jgi:hypothetical protein
MTLVISNFIFHLCEKIAQGMLLRAKGSELGAEIIIVNRIYG